MRTIPDGQLRQAAMVPMLLAAVAITAPVSRAAAQASERVPACPADAPVSVIGGQNMYVDKQASITDSAIEAANQAASRSVQMFVIHMAAIVDNPQATTADFACAQRMMARWAAASALLGQPASFEGQRQRARFAIGLNVVALKLRARGHPVDAGTERWLMSLGKAAVKDFQSRAATRGWIDNLDIWSGVNAASTSMLAPDPAMRGYADAVWHRGLDQIALDGTVKSELARGGRALLYHQYYLSGLLMLRGFREAAGMAPSPSDDVKLQRLAKFVAAGICNPADMSVPGASGGQEMPPPYQFAVPAAFGQGILPSAWFECAKLPKPLIDSGFGGDMARLASVLTSLRQVGPAG